MNYFITKIVFLTKTGHGSVTLRSVDGVKFVRVTIGDRTNSICITATSFIYILTELRSSMLFSNGPFNFICCEEDRFTNFRKGTEKFVWTHIVKGREVEVLESDNEDIDEILKADNALINFF